MIGNLNIAVGHVVDLTHPDTFPWIIATASFCSQLVYHINWSAALWKTQNPEGYELSYNACF